MENYFNSLLEIIALQEKFRVACDKEIAVFNEVGCSTPEASLMSIHKINSLLEKETTIIKKDAHKIYKSLCNDILKESKANEEILAQVPKLLESWHDAEFSTLAKKFLKDAESLSFISLNNCGAFCDALYYSLMDKQK